MNGALPADAVEPSVFRRLAKRKRVVESATATAAEMIGPIEPGADLCGITNGQFSLIDMIEHVLGETGPADVVISTWTMGIYDPERAYAFVRDGRIRRIRFIVDPSMFTRRPELSSVLVKAFGPDAFRAVNSHAKFATIRGDDLAVVIRSSMNLNPNNRIESFDITADDALVGFFEDFADKVFAAVDARNRSQSRAIFEGLLEAQPVKAPTRPNPFVGLD